MQLAILLLLVLCVLLGSAGLAHVARLSLNHDDAVTALIAAHNWTASKVNTLSHRIDEALDCLVTVDAQASTNSDPEVHEQ